MKKEVKKQAKIFRKRGYSFREISEMLNISKSTASLWCRNEFLNQKAKERIKKLGDVGRERGNITAKKKREKELKLISANCSVLMSEKYDIDDYKLFLALLYWGEGGKTNNYFNFINSDPEMIKSFLYLFRKSFVVDEEKFRVRLHLHEYHDIKEMIDFWPGIAGIEKNKFSIYNKSHTGINKKPGYKGCISVRYGNSKIFKEIFIIIDRFIKTINNAGLV
jgi:transcriptional regulator with XRE-family HTH domain